MSAADIVYTPRFVGSEHLVRGRDNRITCPVYRAGALVAVTAVGSSAAVYRADGTLVGTFSVTVLSSIPGATIPSATLASEQYSSAWRIEWSLVMPDGIPHVFKRMAVLGRSALYPVVTDADLLRRHSDLADQRPASMTSFQDYLDEAWAEVVHKIRQKGSLPHLVSDPEDLRYVLMYETLAGIYLDWSLAPGSDSKWAAMAVHYQGKAKEAWGTLSLQFDMNEDGAADEVRSASPVTFLGTAGNDWNDWT